MIVGPELAARLEGTLADDVGSFVAAVAQLDPGCGAGRERIAGGWAQSTGAGRFGNRVQGAGVGVAASGGDLDRVEAFYRSRGLPVEVELCPLADGTLLSAMAARRCAAVGFRNVYAHELRSIPPPAGQVEVVSVRDEPDFERWSETLLDGFGYATPGDRARVAWWNRVLFGLPEATLLLALERGVPVGAANILVRGRTASLGGTASRPGWRRRGVQAALLSARLELARAAGCSLAVVTADPGGTSARNCERAGFQLAYTNVRLRA